MRVWALRSVRSRTQRSNGNEPSAFRRGRLGAALIFRETVGTSERDTAYAQLSANKKHTEASLRAELQQLTLAKAESEDKLNEKYKRLEQMKLQETTMLKNRVDRLSKLQDAALNAGGSKARALLYMASMKSIAQQGSTMSVRGEDDPTGVDGGAGGSPRESGRESPRGA